MLRTRLLAGTTAGFVLSAVFATVLTMVDRFETFFEPLRVEPTEPAPITLRLPATMLRGADQPGAPIRLRTVRPTVHRGETVVDTHIAHVIRLYETARRPPSAALLVSVWFLFFMIALLLTTYLRSFTASRGALLRTQAGLLGLTAFLVAIAKVFLLLSIFPVYVIPVAAVPLWAALYLDRRTAFMVAMGVGFCVASLVGFGLVEVAVTLASGMSAGLAFRDRKHTTQLITAGAVGGIAAVATLVAAKTLFEGGIDIAADIATLDRSEVLAALLSGPLAGLVAFSLQGFAVAVLGAVSRQRLLELSDLEQPLLQKMSKEAPGSWEHARAMANIAEAAAAAVRADALLTRVGAYYHDLGKTIQPKYFVENLDAGEASPHEQLAPDVSADAIMAHVVEGTRILREGGVPEPVVEFAYTHHGTSVIEYFWHKELARGNPKELTENHFRYPGMRPRTKETAILMLVDSIEAASRTIIPPDREKFEEMVQRIVYVKLGQGQLDECGLTLEDLRVMSTRLVDTLCNVYHSRIRYPWQDAKDRGEASLPVGGLATEADMQAFTEAEGREPESFPPPTTDPPPEEP